MAFCTKCGQSISDTATFCPHCGESQSVSGGTNAQPTASGMSENAAALLSYVLGWITGLIFYFIDKRPYVRFHAAQSIVTFGGLHIIRIILGTVLGVGWWVGGVTHWGAGLLLFSIISLLSLVLWIVCMIKAYQGVRFKLPVAGDIAENLAK
jgi:uncharacterized membrane protein